VLSTKLDQARTSSTKLDQKDLLHTSAEDTTEIHRKGVVDDAADAEN
jgi:hypothetical protein